MGLHPGTGVLRRTEEAVSQATPVAPPRARLLQASPSFTLRAGLDRASDDGADRLQTACVGGWPTSDCDQKAVPVPLSLHLGCVRV